MALQDNKDSFETKALSLSEFVLQCADCHKLCLEKTARVVENRSRAPRGWDSLFDTVAAERRSEDLDMCESRCQYMRTTCPSGEKVLEYENVLATTSHHAKKVKPDPAVLQEASRCEHAVEMFSNVLFALAHKPSKVAFSTTRDPRSGAEKYDKTHDGAPTEAHRKVLEGAKNIDEEILRRWSKARNDRLQMEKQGILRSPEDTGPGAAPSTPPESSGTTPKW
ncbi:putative ribosomal P protein AGP2beta-1 [Leptomonas pyrrhocoris]|uniref:Putative ribosomal P protein AGP2beta-1 n=1 Tax=Leptomonas pyrrhocoris TaxID=157538 RepID=A0A0N0DY40_LEPPY|nr:putative ribosomal P protein AGP2beta-1 [Leptomonas pyrrhocoris]KPA83542.1 putative ribosomal P protein AGP2beta-1 [Leptomonas pyrrhocoris]|eukprot:XP_015661981.1 putative ribosomal P protein AGP2beta-1 [Leptomonas pyrrhocoris]